MIRIAICDDMQIFIDEAATCCAEYFKNRDIEYMADKYLDGRSLLESEEYYDIILLDVEMPDINGVEVKRYIEEQRKGTRIVFVSGYPETMADAFGDNVSGFLVKPLKADKFNKKMDEVLAKITKDNEFIKCDVGEEAIKIFVKDILYIEADGRYTSVHKTDGEIKKFLPISISDYETKGFSELMRCHKSFIVNLEYVRAVSGEVKLKNGETVALGRKFKESAKEELDKYILRRR